MKYETFLPELTRDEYIRADHRALAVEKARATAEGRGLRVVDTLSVHSESSRFDGDPVVAYRVVLRVQ